VLTIAIANTMLSYNKNKKYLFNNPLKRATINNLIRWYNQYPNAAYGEMFSHWVSQHGKTPYRSFGNGSAMRVSPIAYACQSLDEVRKYARLSASVTHNHRQGIKGAQAVASAVYLAKAGASKEEIRQHISYKFGYQLNQTLAQIRPNYMYDSTCQGSVPESIVAFLESSDYESAIRGAISLGGDSDTMACIAGGIAEAFYQEIPKALIEKAQLVLDYPMKKLIGQFAHKYSLPTSLET
jgi:ADP-ribosylglycohydrolase